VRAGEKLKLGPHAIIARTSEDGEYDAYKEEERLSKVAPGLPPMRSGIKNLRSRLPKLFSELIKTNINPLLTETHEKLAAARYELKQIGIAAPNPVLLLSKCQITLDDDQFGRLITPCLENFQNDINKTKEWITKEWTSEKLGKNVTRAPFFQGEEGFLKCLEEISRWWQPILDQFKDSAQKILIKSVSDPIDAVDVPSPLKESIKRQWSSYCEDQIFPEFNKDCDKALEDENKFGTMNNELTIKYGKEIVLPEDLINDSLNMLNLKDYNGYKITDRDIELIKGRVKDVFRQESEKWASKFTEKTLHEQQTDRLFAAVKAAFSVEEKTITDNIMKKTISNLKVSRQLWVRTCLVTDEKIRGNAIEDEETEFKRKHLNEEIAKMKKCEDIISSMS